MSQEFQPHPVLVNYEAYCDVVVRNRRLNKPVGWANNMGYLIFSVGKKSYLIQRVVFETFHGRIKDGFEIDHKNGVKIDNCLENLQAISQRDNLKKKTTTCKSFGKRPVLSFDTTTHAHKIFQSMNAAGRYFDICMTSVRRVAENISKTVTSKRNGHKVRFDYITPKGDYSSLDIPRS